MQGFREDRDFRRALRLLSPFTVITMLGPELALHSAQHYRALRHSGVTVRKTIDVIIGTYCIEHQIPLLHNDRDFLLMVQYLGL